MSKNNKLYRVVDSLGNEQYRCYDYQEASTYKFVKGNLNWKIE